MKVKMILTFSIIFLFSAAIIAQNNENKTKKDKEEAAEFVKKAASGGMMEVQLGKMAQKKGSSKEVREFGELMVKDHSKANDELKAIAKKNDISVPKKLMDEHQKHIDHLSALTGKEFDEAYLDMMLDDHNKDISEFEDASEEIKVTDVKNFAAKTLPVLKKHQEKVEQITKKMDSISRGDSDNNSNNKNDNNDKK